MNPTLHTAATIRRDTGLTDDELRAADAHTRRWYLRVLTLMNDTGCSIALALQAVDANEKGRADADH